jgi:hypothetical protein
MPGWFWPENLSRTSGQLLARLLHYDPHMRLSAEDVLAQPWCRGTNTGAHTASSSRVLFPVQESFPGSEPLRPVRNNSRGQHLGSPSGGVNSPIPAGKVRQRSARKTDLSVLSALPDAVCVEGEPLLAAQVHRLSFDETIAAMGPAGVAVPLLAAEHDHSWSHCGEVGEIGTEYVQALEQQRQKEEAALECTSPSERAVGQDRQAGAHAVAVEAGSADAESGDINPLAPRGESARCACDADVYI